MIVQDLHYTVTYINQGQIQDLVKGGPKYFCLILPTPHRGSCANELSLNWPSSGPALGPGNSWVFITKYAFPPFWGTFLY